ncbi:hypothetical protein NDU88_003149 [Pleurodeles waltl]|uniref:Uncharacterized protein n=1 Tax=Pleurodeles waltl TaxID=8319 RepID=A0AAV7RFR6_PLEWA|nr:hypothetical protein NDU88_003149 [Pleurodeles waltl]
MDKEVRGKGTAPPQGVSNAKDVSGINPGKAVWFWRKNAAVSVRSSWEAKEAHGSKPFLTRCPINGATRGTVKTVRENRARAGKRKSKELMRQHADWERKQRISIQQRGITLLVKQKVNDHNY